jgi:hypothetical protein
MPKNDYKNIRLNNLPDRFGSPKNDAALFSIAESIYRAKHNLEKDAKVQRLLVMELILEYITEHGSDIEIQLIDKFPSAKT